MDGSRFDDLTRFMAERPSRRTVVKAMVGAMAGSLASVGTALGTPRCKRVNQACQTTADCCPGPTANGNVYCKQVKKSTKVCATCPPEAPTACNGGCISTASDNNNCGSCGNVCHGGASCANGVCRCPAGQHLCADGSCHECCTFEHCVSIIGPGEGAICCDGTCQASRFNPNNCGGCGIVCAGDQVCADGDCKCPTGQASGPDGTCTCGGSDCSATEPCCNGYYCNFGVCLACETTGGSCENSGDPGRPQNVACCSGMCDPSTLTCL
jgi:hypothetical protein